MKPKKNVQKRAVLESAVKAYLVLRPCEICSSSHRSAFCKSQYSRKPSVQSLSGAKPWVRIFPRTPVRCVTGQIA